MNGYQIQSHRLGFTFIRKMQWRCWIIAISLTIDKLMWSRIISNKIGFTLFIECFDGKLKSKRDHFNGVDWKCKPNNATHIKNSFYKCRYPNLNHYSIRSKDMRCYGEYCFPFESNSEYNWRFQFWKKFTKEILTQSEQK